MKKPFPLLLALAVFFGACTPQAQAGNAGLLLSPTRIVFEKGKKYTTITVRNTGDAAGRYKVELVDASMDENGGIKLREDGSKEEFSAVNLLSLSPSNMTLNADEGQTVRLLVKGTDELPDGEYRSHLQVRMTEANINPDISKPVEGAGISIQTKMTTVIPVIIRKGETSYTLTIDDAKLVTGGGNNKQAPELKVAMSFSGNRSLLGDIKVTHIAPDATETQLAFFPGVAIYRNVPKRNQSVALTVPEGLNIHSGHLRVDFLSQENEGSHVVSEKIIAP